MVYFMGLINGVTNLSVARTMGEVQIAVARKILDTQKDQGAAALQLLEAASGAVNQAGDQLVAAATGLGGLLDTRG